MKDIEEVKEKLPKIDEQKGAPINALPEYKIRTMKDDLAKIGFKKLEKEAKEAEKVPPLREKEVAPPEELPVAIPRAPLPTTEELITEKAGELPLPPSPAKPIPDLAKLLRERKIVKRKPKTLIILVIIALVLSGIGLIFYWQGAKQPPLPEPEPEPQPAKLSERLILMEETKIISLKDAVSLFELLKEEVKLDQPISSFKRMAILKNEKEFLSLLELFGKLEITSPPYVLTELGENYNLVIFSQSTGKRLGLVIEIKNPQALKEQLRFWEETMLEDFKNFYPAEAPGQPASETFLDDIYRAIDIRYTNLPYSTLTINYTIINNLLIIGTSKEIMYTTIDRILD